MELLLNLAWMLLLLPAYWLWRRGAGSRAARRVTALQCGLALGCAVVLLFPVISATDDLHAMRAEMEESASSKRAVRQAASEKSNAGMKMNRLQGPPALLASAVLWFAPVVENFLVAVSDVHSLEPSVQLPTGRAPPSSLLV
jgi:hypothetical protein